MDKQQWLDALRVELIREKLPLAYIERITSELSDHFTDLMEDRMSTDAPELSRALGALGRPRRIAHAAGREYRKSRFCGRHPWLSFVILPIVALPLLWAASIIGIILIGYLLPDGKETGLEPPAWLLASLPHVMQAIVAIPVLICAALFCWLAVRSAVSWKWTLAACLILAVIGSMAVSEVGFPFHGRTTHVKGTLKLGLSLNSHPQPAQVFQFALPLAIGGWVIWRQSTERRRIIA